MTEFDGRWLLTQRQGLECELLLATKCTSERSNDYAQPFQHGSQAGQIELFFKWVKENLKIKSFLGTSKNAVMTQIWVAMCVYLLLAYLKFLSKATASMQQILRLLQLNLFIRRDLPTLLRGDPPEPLPPPPQQQLAFA